MTTINSIPNALIQATDSTGVLNLQTNSTTALSIASNSQVAIANTMYVANSTTFATNVSMPNTFGFKNRIINGAMVISQYNGTNSTTANNNVYAIDRFIFKCSQASKFSIQQLSASPPAGFNTYIGLTVTSPVTIGSGDYFALGQRIEAYNIQDFGLGTANNQPFVLSFWVYSSLTGTFGGAITSGGGDACYGFNYSIASANTWTYITVPIIGTATGTWNANSTSMGMQVYFGLGVGSTYSATAGSWGTTNVFSSTGSVSVVATNGATWYATGIQIEKGTQATAFDYRPYGTELQLCQRYYEASGLISWSGSTNNGSTYYMTINFATPKRAAPTVVTSSSDTYGFAGAPTAINISTSTAEGTNVANASVNPGKFRFTFTASAEL